MFDIQGARDVSAGRHHRGRRETVALIPAEIPRRTDAVLGVRDCGPFCPSCTPVHEHPVAL